MKPTLAPRSVNMTCTFWRVWPTCDLCMSHTG